MRDEVTQRVVSCDLEHDDVPGCDCLLGWYYAAGLIYDGIMFGHPHMVAPWTVECVGVLSRFSILHPVGHSPALN